MKGRNRLVPRLLGITRESVLRVDENTKEVLKAWPLTTVRRWAASPNSFTLVSICNAVEPSDIKLDYNDSTVTKLHIFIANQRSNIVCVIF